MNPIRVMMYSIRFNFGTSNIMVYMSARVYAWGRGGEKQFEIA